MVTKLGYEQARPSAPPPTLSSLLWFLAALGCGWFLWLCIALAEGQINDGGGVAFVIGIALATVICLIKAVRPLFK